MGMTSPLAPRFWQGVAAVMAFRGLSDSDLADLVGMDRTALNSKKNGKRRTTLEDVDAVLSVLPELQVRLRISLGDLSDNRQYQSLASGGDQGSSHILRAPVEVPA